MKRSSAPFGPLPPKPISVGLTCWRWERKRTHAIILLAQSLGVTLQLTEKVHGLQRDIVAQVSGGNIDRFLGEFVRRC